MCGKAFTWVGQENGLLRAAYPKLGCLGPAGAIVLMFNFGRGPWQTQDAEGDHTLLGSSEEQPTPALTREDSLELRHSRAL